MERVISPELRRNCWLELTPTRLALMPAVLVLVFYFVHSLAMGQAVALVPTAGVLFFLIAVAWGAHLAVSGLAQEVANQTWDWQRMSSITPLEMTAGKLLGSPIYAWYGGLLCVAVFLAAGLGSGIERVGYGAAILVGIALLVHASAVVFTGLALAKYGASSVTRRRSAAALLGFAALLVLSRALDPGATVRAAGEVSWYGAAWSGDPFWLASVYAFALWAWLGALYQFRAQLGHRNSPWIFAAFTVFLMAYVAGFVEQSIAPWAEGLAVAPGIAPGDGIAARLLVAAIVAGALTLLMLFQERHDPVAYRRLLHRSERFPGYLLPRWGVAFALATLTMALWVVLFGLNPAGGAVVAAWLFLLRDAAVILALNLRAVTKPANGLVLVYLAVVYALLPGIFGPSSLFAPHYTGSITALVLPPAVEAAGALALLRLVWRRHAVERPA